MQVIDVSVDSLAEFLGISEPVDLKSDEAEDEFGVPIDQVMIMSGETYIFDTGIAFELPKGYFGAVFVRSSIGIKKCLRLCNSVPIIDNDYRGEVKILLENAKSKDPKLRVVPAYMTVDGEVIQNDYKYGFLPEGTVVVKKGDRIAQAMAVKIGQVQLTQVKKLSETERGEGGLGSTGTK